MKKKPRYSAYITTSAGDPVSVIYQDRPSGNLIGELPLGAHPKPKGECGTLDRTDGGDPFERALFILPSGRHVEIRRVSDEDPGR